LTVKFHFKKNSWKITWRHLTWSNWWNIYTKRFIQYTRRRVVL